MQKITSILSLIIYAVLLAVIAGLWFWHKKEIRRKNKGLFHYIDKEHEMKEALKRERIEKETLMRVIRTLNVKREALNAK